MQRFMCEKIMTGETTILTWPDVCELDKRLWEVTTVESLRPEIEPLCMLVVRMEENGSHIQGVHLIRKIPVFESRDLVGIYVSI